MSPREDEAIRIEIEGEWSVYELGVFLGDLALLFVIRFALDLGRRGVSDFLSSLRRPDRYDPWPFSRRWSLTRPDEQLTVLRVQYGSPGFVDLLGIGKIVEQLRLFVEKLIDLRATRLRRGLENEAMRQEIKGKMIENARDFVRLAEEARDLGLSDYEIKYLVELTEGAQERLFRQIAQGNVAAIGPVPPSGESTIA